MRALKLDFLHPHPRPGWPAWLMLAAGLALAGWTAWHDGQLDRAIAAQLAEQSRLNATPRLARAARVASAPGQAGTVQADEQLSLPWNALLSRLEKVQSRQVALLSLEADGRKTEATLTAEARSLNDMLAYIETLKRDAGFRSVTLSSHVLREEDPQLPYRFVLRLGWRN
jgi:Tfp pilus assembly protein PilN